MKNAVPGLPRRSSRKHDRLSAESLWYPEQTFSLPQDGEDHKWINHRNAWNPQRLDQRGDWPIFHLASQRKIKPSLEKETEFCIHELHMTATYESLPNKTFVWPMQYLLFSSACLGEEADSSTVPTSPWSLTINLSAHISYLLETWGMSYTFKNRQVMTTDLCGKPSTAGVITKDCRMGIPMRGWALSWGEPLAERGFKDWAVTDIENRLGGVGGEGGIEKELGISRHKLA